MREQRCYNPAAGARTGAAPATRDAQSHARRRRALTVVQRASALPGQRLLDLPVDPKRLLLPARQLEAGLGGQRQAGAVQLAQYLLAQHGADVALVAAGAAAGHGCARWRHGAGAAPHGDLLRRRSTAGARTAAEGREGPERDAPRAQCGPRPCPARRAGAGHGCVPPPPASLLPPARSPLLSSPPLAGVRDAARRPGPALGSAERCQPAAHVSGREFGSRQRPRGRTAEEKLTDGNMF